MVNFIAKETWELWKDNIAYLVRNGSQEGRDSDDISESVLEYLEGEGAFSIIEDEHPLPAGNPTCFKAGQGYTFTDWFTGGGSFMTVKEVVNRKVTFDVNRSEADGSFKATEAYDILFDEEKNSQYVLIYEYKGKEARVYAKE